MKVRQELWYVTLATDSTLVLFTSYLKGKKLVQQKFELMDNLREFIFRTHNFHLYRLYI